MQYTALMAVARSAAPVQSDLVFWGQQVGRKISFPYDYSLMISFALHCVGGVSTSALSRYCHGSF